jgi:hypothetical protein
MSKELETSWRNAFDFVQKFYLEISYLIKEVEGQLAKEPEKFVICRKTGYGVTSYNSTQLDARYVPCWIPATLMVAFVPEDCTKLHQGVTITPIKDSLRPLLLHVEAHWSGMQRPIIHSGILERVRSKRKDITKFEHLMFEFAYNPDDVFAKLPEIDYADRTCSLTGRATTTPVFSINSAQDVKDKLVDPMLKQFRKG